MITVIVVTHNRAAMLRECLESLEAQRSDRPDWRVLVVDNGSTDETASLATGFCQRLERFSYMFEPKIGASRARNRGAGEAQTPYLLFVDDECVFPGDYLDTAHSIIGRGEPVCFGGPIEPRFWPRPVRPKWFKDAYGAYSMPGTATRQSLPDLSAGNLGVSRRAFAQVGGFAAAQGPIGRHMNYGEENILVQALASKFGADKVIYEPSFVNRHLVRPEKFKWRTIISENFRRGMARGRLYGLDTRALAPPVEWSELASSTTFASAKESPTKWTRIAASCKDALLDLTFLRRYNNPTAYPHWQNFVYERWMPYVRWVGIIAGTVTRPR
ncbi:MAG: glycosyltransferase family 2 protein [Hyphomicrobium sp.]